MPQKFYQLTEVFDPADFTLTFINPQNSPKRLFRDFYVLFILYRVIQFTRGIFQRCLKVIRHKVGHLLKNLFRVESGCKQIQNVGYSNSRSGNTRTTSALFRIYGNSFLQIVRHGFLIIARSCLCINI